MLSIFKISLQLIADLLDEQVHAASKDHIRIDEVVVIGGYGDIPALKQFLREGLEAFDTKHPSSIRPIFSEM
jgi:hypothetical protein